MTAPRAILFGKLPSHGDFVARGLDADRQAAWDGWLSGSLDLARQRLGDAFHTAHDAAPPWCFVSGPGRFGGDWRAGALAASVDSVGRRFFIVIAVDGLAPTEAMTRGEPLAGAMEDLIYRAFESGWTADTAVRAAGEALAGAGEAVAEADGTPQERWWTLAGPEGAPLALATQPADLIWAAGTGRIL
jgi:type VI secretion system protein ImpM